jgi:hypothetical protein
MGLGDDRIQLHVLDTIEPRSVRRTLKETPAESTTVIVASKSGSTLEPNSLLAVFWDRAARASGDGAGRLFAAITDSASPLEAEAHRLGFRKVFASPSDVGGRFSALSEFGLVPAAMMGVEVRDLLEGGALMAHQCGPNVPAAPNPGLFLAAVLGAAASAGRDKVTFVADPPLVALPEWIEQLIAESSGKAGRGIFPIVGEPLGPAESYGADRLLVYLRQDGSLDRHVQRWTGAGLPVVVTEVGPGAAGIGAEFLRWEFATAVVCHLLGVNAFDQPDVQRAKDRAGVVLRSRKATGLPEGEQAWEGDGIRVWAHHLFPPQTTLEDVWRTILEQLGERETLAFLVYLAPSPATTRSLTRLRKLVRDRSGRATMLGYGPRYLHSTGQLFKGGPDRLVSIYLVGPADPDVDVPGKENTLGALWRAQAVGDFEAMHSLGRRTYAFVIDSMQRLEAIEAALSSVLGTAHRSIPSGG